MDRPPYRTLIPLFDELRSDRIVVRPYVLDDAPDLFEAVAESRDHIRPWLPFADAHQTLEETRDWITRQLASWLLRDNMNMSIWEASSGGRFLGGTGLHPHNWDIRYLEIGYWLRASAEGHGYMTEAVRLLTDWTLTTLGANRLEIRCDERNTRSAAVARRLGYVQEARLRNDSTGPDGSLRNTLIFSRIAGEEPGPEDRTSR